VTYVDTTTSSLRGLPLHQANDPQRLRVFLQRVAEAHGSGSARKAKSVLNGVLAYAVDSRPPHRQAAPTAGCSARPDEHVEVEATWGIDQRMVGAYREPDRAAGGQLMAALIDALSHGLREGLTEVITLGHALTRRAADISAYFGRPGTSNALTELRPSPCSDPAA
jgi:hypothetical protein